MKKILILLLALSSTVVLGFCGENDPIADNSGSGSTTDPDPGTDPDPDEPEPTTFMKYYVAENGNDDGPGTLESPFRTITTALLRVNPGDTVLVREGTYHEFVTPLRSGEKDRVITLMSYPGETARIDGTGLSIKGWYSPLIMIKGVDYMTFENLHVCNATNAAPNSDPKGFLIMGSPRGITLRGCKIYGIKSLATENSSADWRSAHAIQVTGTEDRPIRDLLIENCEIFENHTGTSESLTIAGNVDGFIVRNCYVHDVENIGIIVAGGDTLNPGGDISVNYARNGTVEGNLVERCTHTKSPEYWGPTAYGAIGIYICGGANTIVERNIVRECDRGIGLVSESDLLATRDCIVRNNFVSNCNRTGIYLGDYLNYYGAGTDACQVVNNTLFNNNSVGGALDLDAVDGEGEIRLTENCTNNVIKNNIVYARPERDIFVRKYTATGSNNVIDYNHYYSQGAPKWIWDGVEYTDFAAWQKACGGDAHSVFGMDPRLVSDRETDPDLHLQADSPARLTGEFISTYIHGTVDVDGDPRVTNGRINKGADQ